jgi:branched-chain amino acid transport system ATP-binding protein/branched-chain amino acid transport system permease protein
LDYVVHIVNVALIYAALAASLNLVLGYGGMATMAHAALFGVGAYTSALVTMHFGVSFLVGMAAAAAVAGAVGIALALPSLRIRDEYLILFTCAFQLVVWGLMVNEVGVTGGETGLSGIPRAALLGLKFTTPRSYLPLVAVIVAAMFLTCWRVSHSPFGRVLRCIREDEPATASLGKDVLRFKALTFLVGGALAGAAGGLLAHYNAYVNPVSFSLDASILLVAMVVLGGSANMLGSVVGSALLIGIPEALRFVPGTATLIAPLRTGIFGALLVLFMRFRPEGLLPEHLRLGRRRRPKLPELPAEELQKLVTLDEWAPLDANLVPMLEVKGLSRSFGGILAVNGFSMALTPGRVTTLIGPNGCGKTTVFNMVSGFLAPDDGRIYLRGEDVTRCKPHELVARGVIRSWQDVRIFRGETLLGNVMAAMPRQLGESLVALFLRPREVARQERENERRALAYLKFVGLEEKALELAGELSFAEQKELSLARLLASRCSILLLDEPASGLDRASIGGMGKEIVRLAQAGRTVCLVEHNLDVVKDLSDETIFMDQGRVVRKARPEELMRDPELARIYFGG